MPDATYHVYRAEQRRRRRWPYIVIAAVCVFAAVVGWQLYGVPRVSAVTPGPDAFVKNPSTTVVLDVRGLAKLKDVAVTLDGKDVTADAQRDGDTLTLTTARPRRRRARGRFSAAELQPLPPRGPQGLALHRRHEHPRAASSTAPPTRAASTPIRPPSAATPSPTPRSPSSTATIKASGTADASGKYAVSADLPDGASDVAITTADRAGNATTKKLDVFVDAQPPVLKVTSLDKTHEEGRHLRARQGHGPARRAHGQVRPRRRAARPHRPRLQGQVQGRQASPRASTSWS